MENIPEAEHTAAYATFGRVTVARPDKTKKLLPACKRCRLIQPPSILGMWRHWKYDCVYKFLYRYVSPTNEREKVMVQCLVSLKKVGTTPIDMTKHRPECKKKALSDTSNKTPSAGQSLLKQTVERESTPAAEKAADIDLNQLQYDEIQFILPDKKRHSGTKCRLCNAVFIMDTLNLLYHRTQCKSGSSPELDAEESEPQVVEEVLISVQTVHTLHTPQQSTQSEPTAALNSSALTENSKYCFVCNAPCKDSDVKLFGHVMDYSQNSIYDLIRKLLGSRPSVRNASSLNDELICPECIGMIDTYDVARSKTKQLKEQLRQKLAITEAYFEQRLNPNGAEETANDGIENDRQQQQPETKSMDVFEKIDLCEDD